MKQYFNEAFDVAPKRARECWRASLEFGVMLHQRGPDRFVVTYGKQVDDELTYSQACMMLGAALLHALSCEGSVDNASATPPAREPGVKVRLVGTRRTVGALGRMYKFETFVIAADPEDAMATARANWADQWQDISFDSAEVVA